MRIVYCIRALYNPGGMERVLLNKVSWLCANTDYEIAIITTDQMHRSTFYCFPPQVKIIDLEINYEEDKGKNPIAIISGYLLRRHRHKVRLAEYLRDNPADIVVSLFPSESSFIPSLKDGSRKVLELHFCRFFRLQYGRKGLIGFIDHIRSRMDAALVRRFDRFVVLTEEDAQNWGYFDSLCVIPNAVRVIPHEKSRLTNKRVIAVGRLDYQKGFDNLIKAWGLMMNRHPELAGWYLDIFGQGEWHDMLQKLATDIGVSDSIYINKPTNNITAEYLNSSLLVMSSNYEGFGMVLVEAMACGVPCVAFDCPCGPSEIIEHEHNGLLVKNGDIEGLANAMMRLMENEEERKAMGSNARKVTETYSEESVMKRWVELFVSLTEK